MADHQQDTLSIVLSNAFLDRNGARPLHVQIRNAIELAIFSGEIPDGAPLPSVRQLSEALQVAPNTVIRAYHDLRSDEWIDAAPKRGYFVRIEGSDQASEAARSHLASLIDPVIDSAVQLGVSETTLLQLVAERIRARRGPIPRIAVVGNQESFLAGRVSMIKEATADLNVDVIGVSYQELETDSDVLGQIGDVDLFLVPVGETLEARRLLGEQFSRFVPMTRTLRPDVKEFLMNQPEDVCFGAIASTRQNMSRLVGILKQQHPLRVTPITASIEDPDTVEYAIQHADVLAISSLSRPHLPPFDKLPKPSVEIAMVPDEKTIRRLRDRLIGS